MVATCVKLTLLLLFVVLAAARPTVKQLQENVEKIVRGEIGKEKRDLDDTCEIVSCAAIGASCSGLTSLCTNSYCNYDNFMCTAYTGVGLACTADNACGAGSCINGKCNAEFDIGSSCVSDNQCAYELDNGTYVTSCAQNKCAGLALGAQCDDSDDSCASPLFCGPSGTCVQPLPLGASCDDSSNCEGFLVCDNTCKAPLSSGATCSIRNDLCGSFVCIPTDNVGNGRCGAPNSQAAGGLCDTTSHCADGLVCNDTITSLGTCQSRPATPSGLNCTDDKDCRPLEACECSSTTGVNTCRYSEPVTPTGSKNAAQQVLNCIATCPSSGSEESCVFSTCQTQYCAFLTLVAGGQLSLMQPYIPTCEYQLRFLVLQNVFDSFGLTCTIPTTTSASSTTKQSTTTSGSASSTGSGGSTGSANTTGSGSTSSRTSSGSGSSSTTNPAGTTSSGSRVVYTFVCLGFAALLVAAL